MNVSVSHPTDNVNFVQVNLSGYTTIFFSYETPIAFYNAGDLVIRENAWSTTTGKHLNWINPDKSIRISGKEFDAKLETLLKRLAVTM